MVAALFDPGPDAGHGLVRGTSISFRVSANDVARDCRRVRYQASSNKLARVLSSKQGKAPTLVCGGMEFDLRVVHFAVNRVHGNCGNQIGDVQARGSRRQRRWTTSDGVVEGGPLARQGTEMDPVAYHLSVGPLGGGKELLDQRGTEQAATLCRDLDIARLVSPPRVCPIGKRLDVKTLASLAKFGHLC